MGDDPCTWSVELPARGTSGLSQGAKPLATLVLGAADEAQERVELPVSVARVLARKARDGQLDHVSRRKLLERLRSLSLDCANDRLASLLGRREYSRLEARDRLARDGYAPDVCDEAVAHAVRIGLVDDARYADALVRARLAGGWGKGRIERELRRRGIDIALLRGWPDAYLTAEDEEERALAVARTRRIAPTHGYERLVRYLAGRGFDVPLAMRVARRVVSEADDDAA